jgi:hypothetical protein
MQPQHKPLTIAAFGARGTGKTQFTLQLIEATAPPRLAVWDFKHDPGLDGLGTPYTWDQMGAMVRDMGRARFAVRFQPDHAGDIQAQFEFFCRACWEAGNLLMFVDELPEVTKANKAPPAWRRCVNVGRDYRGSDGGRRALSIIGVGQRAAECDKSFISNADIIHCGRLANPEDARQMSKVLGVRPEEITSMPDLHWIERRASEIEPRRGVLSFTGNKKPQKKPPAKTAKKRP